VDGIPLRRASELFGYKNVVFFSPEDLQIIKNGPSHRRKFIDCELCQLDKIYLHHLANYNKILNQRNRMLKEMGFRPDYGDLLDVLDQQLVRYGSEMIRVRTDFVKRLGAIVEELHGNLSGNQEQLQILYEPDVGIDEFFEILRKNRERDIKTKITNAGPHRDDINFMINGIDIRRFGSQGQQRTAALSLKLAEIRLVEMITGEKPVLLLDDVLSELDSNRQNYLLNSIQNIQTLITCTGLDDFVNNRFHIDRVYRVTGGHIIEKGLRTLG
jgi:DNA replication and repair protein RecF